MERPISVAYKSLTASFAAGSVFATDLTLPCATGESRHCAIIFATATVNTLRLGFNDGTQSTANMPLRAGGEGTTNFTASHIVYIPIILQGGIKYSFSQSSAGTVVLFDFQMLE